MENQPLNDIKTNTKKAVFMFPGASGHVNPSLPLARGLVALGWQVEYVGGPDFKSAIVDTGATFVDIDIVFSELLSQHGSSSLRLFISADLAEYGAGAMWGINFGSISSAKLFQPFRKWLESRNACLVVYCPVLSQLARFAAASLRIPHVSLLTTAGPGYWDAVFAAHGMSADALVNIVKSHEANSKAVVELQVQLVSCLPELTLNTREDVPLVFDYYCSRNLVSTIPALSDPLNARDAALYEAAGKTFTFVGPLLDIKKRKADNNEQEEQSEMVMGEVKAAVDQGRKVIYVSMGTVVTSDHPNFGWQGTNAGASSLTGKQICQSVYRAVFTAVGSKDDDAHIDQKQNQSESSENKCSSKAPLIVVSLGKRHDSLEGIAVPSNAICVPRVPQVALLKLAKPALFVTNGGQNSIMEAMSVGIPFVVCPGFGDQVSNAAKIQAKGLGLKVDRPPKGVDQKAAIDQYQALVERAVCDVLSGGDMFTDQSVIQTIVAELANAGGVDEAIRILLQTADQTTMSTIPSVTTSKQSVVVPLPLGDVWQLIRPGTFEWQTNLVAKTEKTGANRVISYKDKTQQTIQLTEISDRNYKLSWTMIISDPPVSYTSRDDTINLTSITALSQGINAQTLIEWDSNFSNDVTIEVIMDSNLKKQDAFADLIDMSDTMEIDDSGPNSEIQIVTVPYHGSGIPRKSNFKVVSCNVPEIKDGEILVRSLHISVDPYLRGKLAGLKVKDVPISGTVAEIVETRAQDFKVGDKIFQYLPWRKLNALKPSGPMFRKVSTDLEPSTALGVAGMPGFTAYVGLLKIGKLSKKDKTVFVSGAAGAVGTVVGQIAKIMKCRVVGTCGSAEKCKYLTEELGFDVALNCKTHGTSALMRKAISEKCPDGIDIYFDNTGGHTTEAVFDFLNKFARVPICGQIAYYNATKQPMTEAFLSKTIYKCITIQGFVQNEYLQFHDDFLRDITEWIKNGKVKYRETVLDGFHKVPEAFIGLFSGKNIGKMVVSV